MVAVVFGSLPLLACGEAATEVASARGGATEAASTRVAVAEGHGLPSVRVR